MGEVSWATKVASMAIAGQLAAFLLGVIVARSLSIVDFEAYVVASAAFIWMVTFVPQGLEKFAVNLIPPLLERADWSPLRGYLRFATRRILFCCAIAGMSAGLWAWFEPGLSTQARGAIVLSCIALPVGAMVHLGLEVLTVAQRPLAATAIFRVAVPLFALFIFSLLGLADLRSALTAVGAWGLAWAVALVLMARTLWRSLPRALWLAHPKEHPLQWSRDARPFWIYRVLLVTFAQSGIVVLEWFRTSPVTVGAFAIAASSAGLAQVLATATNRGYASRLSALLEERRFDAIQALRLQRLRWIAPPLAAYVVVAVGFAPAWLRLIRPDFAAEGAWPLRILALATALSILLSLAPTYVKFRRKNRTLYRNVAVAAGVQLALLATLVPLYGATGAAVAYAAATCLMYGNLARLAHRELAELRRWNTSPVMRNA